MENRKLTRSPFGQLLVQLRTAAGFSQDELGLKVMPTPLSTRSIAGYEAAKSSPQDYRLPHLGNLASLAEALELSPEDHQRLILAFERTAKLKRAPVSLVNGSEFITAGREEVLNQIDSVWRRAHAGAPQIVLLEGDSGVGKSQLLRNVCDTIAGSTNPVMIAWGEAGSWGTQVEPYLAFRRAFDHILLPPPENSPLPGRYASRPAIDTASAQHVLHHLPSLIGVLISEESVRELARNCQHNHDEQLNSVLSSHFATDAAHRRNAFTDLLIKLSQSWPIVLVLEDLHWAGEYTCQLLLHIAETVRDRTDVPLLIMASCRGHDLLPTAEGHQHPLTTAVDALLPLAHVHRIRLNETMSEASGLPFIREAFARSGLLSKETDRLVGEVFAKTSGHAMMSLELVDYIQREGVGLTDMDHLTERGLEALVPSSFNMVSERLSRLTEQQMCIISIASVMGETILPEPLAEVAELPVATIIDVLDYELVQQHGLLRHGNAFAAQDYLGVTYEFSHAIFREHLYHSLPEQRRKHIHRQIASNLESTSIRENLRMMTLIDEHYVKAEDWASATNSSFNLALHWTSRLDWELSRSAYDRAEYYASHLADNEQLWRIRAHRLSMKRNAGEFDSGIQLAKRIFQQTQHRDWPEIRGVSHQHLGEIYYDMGNMEEAGKHLILASEDFKVIEDWNRAGAAEVMMSHVEYRMGRYDIVRARALQALEFTKHIKDTWVRSEALLAIGNSNIEVGFYEEAIQNYSDAEKQGRRMGKLSLYVNPYINRMLCYCQLQRYDEAESQLEELVEWMSAHDSSRIHGYAYLYLGYANEGLGDYEKAWSSYKRSEQIRMNYKNNPRLSDSRAGLLRMALRKNDREEVRKILGRIEEMLDAQGTMGIEDVPLVLVTVAKAREFLGDMRGYEKAIREAHTILIERASLLHDQVMRDSMTTKVPVNALVMKLYEELKSAHLQPAD